MVRRFAVLLSGATMAALVVLMVAGAAFAQDPAGCRGTVVLDPGHGGADTGAVNKAYNLKESEQNLIVANKLKALLETPVSEGGPGYNVCMTRTTDTETLSNSDRYAYANTTGAKVLVSIHMNGSSNTATDYTTTLFGKWQKDKAFAQTVFKSLSTMPSASGTGTIATKAPYSYASGVLLKSNMPATIAETVFITSSAEGKLLSDPSRARQDQIARSLRAGIESYLRTP